MCAETDDFIVYLRGNPQICHLDLRGQERLYRTYVRHVMSMTTRTTCFKMVSNEWPAIVAITMRLALIQLIYSYFGASSLENDGTNYEMDAV
jgi:hypothetical protein